MSNPHFECSAVMHWCEIELTNLCGLNCFWCVRKQSKKFWFMTLDTFKRIIHFIKKEDYNEIVLSWLWDVFLHTHLYNFLDILFQELPKIQVYIMSKWQSLTWKDIDVIKKYNLKWYNLWITFSIFSLKNKEYMKITWWWDLSRLIGLIRYSQKVWINFNFEFLIDRKNILYSGQFRKFSAVFQKTFHYSIPHNWWWYLEEKIYNQLFDKKILSSFIEKRKKWDICEAFSSKYLFFDYLGNVYKCWLNRFSDALFLWNSKSFSKEKIKKLRYNSCSTCSYFHYKTKVCT